MDLFGIGPVEFLVILALALIVVGPRKLPDLGRQVGRAIYQFRKATQELSDEFAREFSDVNEGVRELRTGVSSELKPFEQFRTTVSDGLRSLTDPITAPAPTQPSPTTSPPAVSSVHPAAQVPQVSAPARAIPSLDQVLPAAVMAASIAPPAEPAPEAPVDPFDFPRPAATSEQRWTPLSLGLEPADGGISDAGSARGDESGALPPDHALHAAAAPATNGAHDNGLAVGGATGEEVAGPPARSSEA